MDLDGLFEATVDDGDDIGKVEFDVEDVFPWVFEVDGVELEDTSHPAALSGKVIYAVEEAA